MPGTKQLYPGPPGSVLHDARVSAGKTVLETAEALNLLNSYVEALEENDYSRFNSPLFARGYIKSYARYMGLDEVPLLNDCDRICKREEQTSQRRSHVQGKVQAPGHAGFILALFAALVVWSLSCWVFDGSEPKELSVLVLDEPFPELAALKKAPSLGESLLSGGLVKVQSEDFSERVLESAELEFKLSEDVWLEVRDGHDNVVLSGVQSKGKALRLSVDGPVTVSASYWPMLAMYYNGQLVEMKELASSNVVRVQVGEL